jgi:hypothetical protein
MIVAAVSIINNNDHWQYTADSDSQSRKIMIEIAILMIVDSIYAVCFIIWRKKIFFFSVVVVSSG